MSLTQINKAGLDEIALDHVFTIGASGSSAYTFQGEGLNGTVNNPTLYLTRGKTYRFENGSGGHPIRIQSTSGASGTAYNTGVTNNAGSGTVIVEVQHDAPDVLYYQCTSHAAMNGILYITGALADGGVTTAKIANSAVTTAKIADSGVTTAKIADANITAAKLASGVQTTINNNADNRVITGSGTANTLNGESNVVVDSSGRLLLGTTTPTMNEAGFNEIVIGGKSEGAAIHLQDDNSNVRGGLFTSDANNSMVVRTMTSHPLNFRTNNTERMRIDASGNIGIGTTSPATALEVKDSADSRITITAGNAISQAGINFSDNSGVDGIVTFDHNTRKLHLGAGTSSFTDGDITINSSGNVGIGTASPSKKLDVSGDFHVSGQILNERGTAAAPTFSFTDDTDTGMFNLGNVDLGFSVGGTERMRIESAGHTRFGPQGAASDAAWSHSTYGNTEVAIDSPTGYSVLHFRGQGAGSTDTRFSAGVGDNKYYMAYDDINAQHRIIVHSSGVVSIPQGIELGSGTDGTPNNNFLDDYEEGNWTPSIHNGGGSISNTYSATYTKIGRLVHIHCYIAYAAGSSTSAFQMGGLPFACLSNNYEVNIVDFGRGGKKGAYCRTNTGNTFMEFLYSSESTGSDRITIKGNMIGNGYIILSNTYITS